ncbi:peptide-methionine (S)-S-oxide reductase MsrA [Serpentinicella sp. ANB-PHB4]|uniref:peptide-methionine (S)-S-oxide reductase MsrA n=1 Tax=Serpentinicella sp. ANB-PHB4 TaxID=3074076 RepID=UPI00285C4CCC|nr:peptide-methionine (S)-S-oxide reductase MsrA [Serpentinicella sp. ANB-PHB4]MDR5658521.1 peptide-methionine (S)-S-oxide reductase MsrA [Serpentinicella sp. ANB-PHB4]
MKEIVLAAGCFWGVEAYFMKINGITETKVGYANGDTETPSYEEVKTGTTNHAEVCYIKYDEEIIKLEEILKHFWRIIDPTIKDRQGPDVGSQYRTGIYYIEQEDKEMILKTKKEEQLKYKDPIVTEVEPLKQFYLAEEYHQRYLEKNPGGYCHINLDF